MMMDIVCGADPREPLGHALFAHSAARRTSVPLRFIPLVERALRQSGLYRRPHERRDGRLWCPISEAPMATDFANSRWLALWLASSEFALFCDAADMLLLRDPSELLALADARYAVQVVKREHAVAAGAIKMDGQAQQNYARKNWSSVVLFNVAHPANARLTLDMVNELPGRDLHRFCWLRDDEIGSLPPEWNHLVGVDAQPASQPALLHFTNGTPELGVECGPYGELWRHELRVMQGVAATTDRAP